MTKSITRRAVALFSGGLDSTLAILTMLKQGIEVKAVTFTHFATDISDGSLSYSCVEKFGFEVQFCHLSDSFMEIVKNPRFGYGKNMNPCIDCKILMLKEAKKLMDAVGSDFIVTGEVLGQRPMSQRKNVLSLIDKEAGVKDYVLRPLSARLLKVTAPEAKGIVNRDMLYGFSGRSRRPQMALAIEFGLTGYLSPAGGCLLTEPNYAHRIKDLLRYNDNPDFKDLSLLKIGRHFRFSPSCKIIVGRNETENEMILSLSEESDYVLKVEGVGSPITLVTGETTEEALKVAASICARYSDAKHLSFVDVSVFNKKGLKYLMNVQPVQDSILKTCRIL
ncbi:MAG: DUF814 domain-containing protein [Nitrospira sp.]|nr:DUF814 domain-containing protein [Nitrospira sp.]